MAIYFDHILQCSVSSPLHLSISWHRCHPCLAVASYSNISGGFVSIYDEQGSLSTTVTVPGEGSATQISAVDWHPLRKILIIACEGGEIYSYNERGECLPSPTQHACSISVLKWSPCGRRLITADQNGALVGWRIDSKGLLEVAFHHELKDRLARLVFRVTPSVPGSKQERDVGELARAAVGGDEEALDLFSSFRSMEGASVKNLHEDLSFYIGAESGIVYFVNSDGSCMEVIPGGSPICSLLYCEIGSRLVYISNEPPAIVQYRSQPDGSLEEISTIKLARKMLDIDAIWAGSEMLALTIVGELTIRLFDIGTSDNYTLDMEGNLTGVEHVSCVAYSKSENILAAGTNLGNIQMWSYINVNQSLLPPSEAENKCWHSRGTSSIKTAVKQLQVVAVQLSASRLSLEWLGTKATRLETEAEMKIRGVHLTAQNMAIWDGQRAVAYELNPEAGHVKQIGSFPTDTGQLILYDQSIYAIEGGKIQVRTFQGTVKQSLGFLENEGKITTMDICGTFLAAVTSLGTLQIWEISRREAKIHTNPKSLKSSMEKGAEMVTSLKVNCDGSKVSISTSEDDGLAIWDVEADAILTLDDLAKMKSELGISSHTSHYWDSKEPRVLVCETRTQRSPDENPESKITFVFVTSEHGIMVQDTISLPSARHARLLGVRVPHYYILEENATFQGEKSPYAINKCTMRDFAGLDEGDLATREAMMTFSFNLAVGNMDEAFRAIKKIKNVRVWENMARMCVKTKRFDVALVCLGSMAHARGAKAIGELTKKAAIEPEVCIAMLAVQLGMLDEAEELYKSGERFDLLNRFYQACGQWEKAIAVAEKNDRIHLRSTFYNYAKYLEAKGDFQKAIANYERSQTHRFEVPRMLFDDPSVLENYVAGSKDENLLKWWAQYMESVGEMETALQCYERAKDSLSLVRVYCYCNNLKKAAEIGNETGNRAACYHLGRKYENNGDVKEAIHFFTRAQAYSNAIRICKEQGMEDQLLNLALLGKASDMLDVARHYESQPDHLDKAVMLYQKAGFVNKAFELAFASDQRGAVEQLARHLDQNVDPRILKRCAEYFVDGGQADQAVGLLAKAKEYDIAISLCVEHNVPLTEEMAEILTPAKDSMDARTRSRLLEKMAEHCYRLENYHLATKKFTQAGNKIMAMKALLKSGDTERITFFANVSRQREIYIMAANYLQTLEWRNEPEIMKTIVTFYTKGKAMELLAGFYDACAQVEIDEFKNYDKALGALNEAYKCMTKATNASSGKLERLSLRLELVKKFVHAKRIYDEEPNESMRLCQSLLKEMDEEMELRLGDVYGFTIEQYVHQKNFKQAYELMQEMQSRLANVNMAYYIDADIVASIHQSMGIPYNNGLVGKDRKMVIGNASLDNEDDNEVSEDIRESALVY